MEEKTILRTKIKSLRKTLDLEQKSKILVDKIKQTNLYKNSSNIMIFYPKKYEINLLNLLEDDKNFYLPRVNGENLEVCPYKINDELKKSNFEIFEPITKSIDPSILDLVIVPALAVDKNGNRLGYGCGYYDRFINNYSQYFKTITAIAEEFFYEKIPANKYDKPINIVITA